MTKYKLAINYLAGNCPVQAEGTICGVPFYFRARGQYWSMGVGVNPDEIFKSEGGWYREAKWGGTQFAAGWMRKKEALRIIKQCALEYRRDMEHEKDGK